MLEGEEHDWQLMYLIRQFLDSVSQCLPKKISFLIASRELDEALRKWV